MAGVKGRLVYRGRNCTVHFDLDRNGIAEIAMTPKLLGEVMDVAQNTALPYALRISPRSTRTGKVHYQDSFVVVPGTAIIRGLRRVAARLYNTASHATAVEVGTARNRAYHVFRNTLDHLNGLGHEHN